MARIYIFMGFIMLFMTFLTLLSYNLRIYQNKFRFQQKFLTNENQKKIRNAIRFKSGIDKQFRPFYVYLIFFAKSLLIF